MDLSVEFQSTLPRGSDVLTFSLLVSLPIFQSTLPRGSDNEQKEELFAKVNFNPRSLAGATGSTTVQSYKMSISIHAPSRERPRVRRGLLLFLFISIHAPSRERLMSIKILGGIIIFQSTLPRGSDTLKSLDGP